MSEEPRAPAVGTQGPRPRLQVDMLYEEALYTVLHRAGTMGPDQVDDEEALLSYLQQASPRPCPLAGLAPRRWGWPRHFPRLLVSLSPQRHTELPHVHTHTGAQADTHRLTGMPRKVGRHTNTSKQKSTQMDTAPKNIGKDR